MTSGAAEAGPAGDEGGLREALSRINRARREAEFGPARVGGLLDGFERLVESLPGGAPGEGRAPAGAASLAELETLLEAEGAGEATAALRRYLEPLLDRLLEDLLDHPERRLAVYGSLLPGEDNHHHVSMLAGRWTPGTVQGRLLDRGWAERKGYPGFLPGDPGVPGVLGESVAVQVFDSLALPDAWERLDAFEQPLYRRILIPVDAEAGRSVCNIYEWIGPVEAA